MAQNDGWTPLLPLSGATTSGACDDAQGAAFGIIQPEHAARLANEGRGAGQLTPISELAVDGLCAQWALRAWAPGSVPARALLFGGSAASFRRTGGDRLNAWWDIRDDREGVISSQRLALSDGHAERAASMRSVQMPPE